MQDPWARLLLPLCCGLLVLGGDLRGLCRACRRYVCGRGGGGVCIIDLLHHRTRGKILLGCAKAKADGDCRIDVVHDLIVKVAHLFL